MCAKIDTAVHVQTDASNTPDASGNAALPGTADPAGTANTPVRTNASGRSDISGRSDADCGLTIAVLAVQGDFAEHEAMLRRLGASCVELRSKEDLNQDYDGLILPGGESTVQGKLLHDLDMYDELKAQIEAGLPVLATCAGLILLAGSVENDTETHLGTLPVTVRRNAYGRQLGSFHTRDAVKGIGAVPMTFIRAPYVTDTGEDAEILARVDGHIVGIRYQNQTAFAFHPELDDDLRIYQEFLKGC